MQVRGTFPELNAGLKKSWKRGVPEKTDNRASSFGISGRGPRRVNAPKTFAGRRAASRTRYDG